MRPSPLFSNCCPQERLNKLYTVVWHDRTERFESSYNDKHSDAIRRLRGAEPPPSTPLFYIRERLSCGNLSRENSLARRLQKGTLLWPQFCGSGKALRNNIYRCYIYIYTYVYNVILVFTGRVQNYPVISSV